MAQTGIDSLIRAFSALITEHGFAIAVAVVLLVAGIVAAIAIWRAARQAAAWFGENAVKPLVSRHGKFLDDMTDANDAIKSSVADIRNSVQHFEGLLTKAECRYSPYNEMRRRPPEANDNSNAAH